MVVVKRSQGLRWSISRTCGGLLMEDMKKSHVKTLVQSNYQRKVGKWVFDPIDLDDKIEAGSHGNLEGE